MADDKPKNSFTFHQPGIGFWRIDDDGGSRVLATLISSPTGYNEWVSWDQVKDMMDSLREEAYSA